MTRQHFRAVADTIAEWGEITAHAHERGDLTDEQFRERATMLRQVTGSLGSTCARFNGHFDRGRFQHAALSELDAYQIKEVPA